MATAVRLVPTTARQENEQVRVTAAELLDETQELLGQEVTVTGVRVDEGDILSPRAFALDDDVLVIADSGSTGVTPGFEGTVSGELIEASTARLLNALDLPSHRDPFPELGIAESAFGDYDRVLVGRQFGAGA